MNKTVTIIPGDWIGPEIAEEVTRIVDSAGAKIEWDWQESGEKALRSHDTPLPQELMDSVERNSRRCNSGFRPVDATVLHELVSVSIATCSNLPNRGGCCGGMR